MTIDERPDETQNQATDPTQLGADQAPATTPRDDARDMSPVLADSFRQQGAASATQTEGEQHADNSSTQGSDFDQRRREGAQGTGDNSAAMGRGQGMGHAGYNGDHDRGYDESGHRGGLGTSGGREDLSDRKFDTEGKPFAGGYGGGNYDQPDPLTSPHIGMDGTNSGEQPENRTEES